MITFFRRFFVAFFTDEDAFKRWMRAFGAGLAMVLLSVVQYAGTDPAQAIGVLKTWSAGDWAARFALGLLFSSVHSPKAEPKP